MKNFFLSAFAGLIAGAVSGFFLPEVSAFALLLPIVIGGIWLAIKGALGFKPYPNQSDSLGKDLLLVCALVASSVGFGLIKLFFYLM